VFFVFPQATRRHAAYKDCFLRTDAVQKDVVRIAGEICLAGTQDLRICGVLVWPEEDAQMIRQDRLTITFKLFQPACEMEIKHEQVCKNMIREIRISLAGCGGDKHGRSLGGHALLRICVPHCASPSSSSGNLQYDLPKILPIFHVRLGFCSLREWKDAVNHRTELAASIISNTRSEIL